jgi:hypothetical protein
VSQKVPASKPVLAGAAVAEEHHPRRWWVLVVISVAWMIVSLDQSFVNVALPRACPTSSPPRDPR